ncbi:MAG TPA: polysaccharide pyruvyl transferase family protein, partial [Longimicrobium sp.]
LFAQRGVETVPVDFGLKDSWARPGGEPVAKPEARGARRAAQFAVRRSRLLRRGINAGRWYLKDRERHARKWEEAIGSCDAVVIGGGQLLVDIGFTFAPRIAEVVRIARRQGKPVAFFGCGAGSQWGPVATRLYGEALGYASYISVRDRASARMVERVLEPGRVVTHADPGFVADTVYPVAAREGTPVVGLGMQPLQHLHNFVPGVRHVDEAAYHDFWATVAAGAAQSGARIELFSNGTTEDHAEATRIHQHLATRGVRATLAERPTVPAELAAVLGHYSAMLCTRMHAGIVGFSLGARVVPISWDRKVNNVWDLLGRGDRVLGAEVLAHPERWASADPQRANAAFLGAEERQKLHAEVQGAADTCLGRLGL